MNHSYYYPNRKNQESNWSFIEGKIDDILTIHLDENATTGYGWAVFQMPHQLCLLESFYTPDSMNSIGSGGTRTILFGGLIEGQGKLKFMYVRPWDLLHPIDILMVDVMIKS